jgi:hypothetical protein
MKRVIHPSEQENVSKDRKIDDSVSLVTPEDIFADNAKFQSELRATSSSSSSVQNIAQRMIERGFTQGIGDHPLGLLILKSQVTKEITGLLVKGAADIPGLHICQSRQFFNEKSMMKLSFSNKRLLDYFISIPGFIPPEYLETGFLDHGGYAIGACTILSIRRCNEYFDLLNVPEDKVASLFPVGGAAIAPQPKSAVEVDQRRQELINLIGIYILSFCVLFFRL